MLSKMQENIKFVFKEVINTCHSYFCKHGSDFLTNVKPSIGKLTNLVNGSSKNICNTKNGYISLAQNIFNIIYIPGKIEFGHARFASDLICKRLHMIGLFPRGDSYIIPPLCTEELILINKKIRKNKAKKTKIKYIPKTIKEIRDNKEYKRVVKALNEVAKANGTTPYLWELEQWNNL